MSQIEPPGIEVLLPVFKLTKTPAVLLPGVLYRVIFKEQHALSILHYFKNNKTIKNSLISSVKSKSETKNAISEEALEEGRTLRKFLKRDYADENSYDWLLLGIIPEKGEHVCTVSRIIRVTKRNGGFLITFEALARGELINKPAQFENGALSESRLRVVSNHVDLGEPLLSTEVSNFKKNIGTLFQQIDKFLRDFSAAASNDKGTFEGKKFALTLSPLATALHFQFSEVYDPSLFKLKGAIENFNSRFSSLSSMQNSEAFLRIIDSTIAILPVARYSFLSIFEIRERLSYFSVAVKNLNLLFESLYKSVDYVETFFADSSDREKSNIISAQLRSIKFTLDTFSPKSGTSSSNGFRRALGDTSLEDSNELELISNFVSNFPSDVNIDGVKMIEKDYKRLQRMPTQHSEYQVLRTYFDVILDIPFGQYINFKNVDVRKASAQLNNDHYGLHHVKKRLLEYVSILKLLEKNDLEHPTSKADDELVLGSPNIEVEKDISSAKAIRPKAPILLLVGPPGVGKTSLAKSIATALGRKFQRVSLGGVRDESGIRGHRRTYVGSMPGVIINALRKAGAMNPLILLDEIDKVCGGANGAGRVNGDPEAALLEVLDPEQNCTFTDHYIGFPVDLSNVLFLCTANDLSTISAPLRDRTEIIALTGYTVDEKINIGSRFLLPKQIKINGLPPNSVSIDQGIWMKMVSEYIREPGVRNLERKIAAICRGKAVEFVEDKEHFSKDIETKQLVKYLGLPDHPISKDLLDKPKFSNAYGVVNGLSYNSSGAGGVLVFEIIDIPTFRKESNSPLLVLTGRLGETLTESVKIGVSFIKSIIARNLISNIDSSEILKRFNNSELHLHVPMGGVSKDGPSAGITITLALLSIALNKPVDSKFAMTGEITLRGKILPIGGVYEKLLGASQYRIKTVLIPKSNREDIIKGFFGDDEDELIRVLNDTSSNEPERRVREKLGLNVIYVDTFWDVIRAVWGNELNIEENNLVSNHL